MIEITPNWHPVLVHFTVAPLLLSIAFYISALMAGNASWRGNCLTAAKWNLYAGIGFAVLTVATGLSAYYSVGHDVPSHAAMTNHRNWAFVTVSLFVALGLWSRYLNKRYSAPNVVFALALIIAAGLLASTAWKGGELVFQYGLGVQSLPEAEGPGHAHSHDDEELSDSTAETAGSEDDHGHEHDHGAAESSEKAGVILVTDGPAGAVNAFRAALVAGDRDAVAVLLSPDVVIFESGGSERSLEVYQSHHMAADMQFLSEVTSELTAQNVYEYGDQALVISESRTRGTYQDKEIDIAGTETIVLDRLDGKWTIVHIHWSSR